MSLSTNSKEKVKYILEELSIELTGSRSIPKLAAYLGYTKQSLYAWINKGDIPLESIISKVKGVNPRFLTGESDQIWKDRSHISEDSVKLRLSDAVEGIDEEPSLDDLPRLVRLRDKLDEKIRKLIDRTGK